MADLNGNEKQLPEDGGNSGHQLAASLAAAVSVGIHLLMVFAISRVDLNFLTQQAPLPPPSRRVMEWLPESLDVTAEVQAEVMTVLRELGVSSPPDVTQVVDELRVAPEEGVTDPPALMSVEMEPELADVSELVLEPPAEQWVPRQEILAVESIAVGDVLKGLERRVIPSIERIPAAPDVAPSVDTERIQEAAPVVVMPAPVAAEHLLAERLETPLPSQDEIDIAVVVPEPGRELFEEEFDEITDIEPVERVLMAGVETFGDRRDRRYSYFRLTLERDGREMLPVRSKDVALIVDISGSVSETRLMLSQEALRRALAYINPSDRFVVIGAGSGRISMFEAGWVQGVPANLRAAEAFIGAMVPEPGGAGDISAALKAVVELERQEGHPIIAIVLTDGYGIPASVMPHTYRGSFSAFVIGHLAQSNFRLLQLVSTWPGLKAEIINTGRFDMLAQVENVMRGIQRPVMSDIHFRFASDAEIEVYPRVVGNLYLDRPLNIYGRYRKGMGRLVVQAIGMAGTARADMIFELPLEEPRDTRGGGDASIRDEFGRQSIYYLVSEYARTRNPAFLRDLRSAAKEFDQPIPYRETIGL